MDVYSQIASKIIKQQEAVIGPLAREQAQKVNGLKFNGDNVAVEGNKTQVLENLVEQYEHIFGQASVEVCKDAAKNLLSGLSPQQVPALLR